MLPTIIRSGRRATHTIVSLSSSAAANPISTSIITSNISASMEFRCPLEGDALTSQAAPAVAVAWLPMLCAALYVLLALLHAHQSGATKHHYMLVVVLGCLAGAAGDCLRMFAYYVPMQGHEAAALAQQLLLLLAPRLFAAVQYYIFSRVLELFGREVALFRLGPRSILAVLLALEGATLVLQIVSLGLSAQTLTATEEMSAGGSLRENALLVAGLGVQLLSCLFFLCILLFFLLGTAHRKDPAVEHYPHYTLRLRLFTAALALGNLLLALRCVFCIVRPSMGSGAKLSQVEWYTYAFGELPVLLCVLLLAAFHPGHVLPLEHGEAVAEARELREALQEGEGILPPPPRGVSRAASSFHCRAAGRAPLSPLSPTITWREASKGHGGMHAGRSSSPDSATTIVDADLEEQEVTCLEFLSGEDERK